MDDELIRWHDQILIADQIERDTSDIAMSFGSCSFTEPVDDMKRWDGIRKKGAQSTRGESCSFGK